MAAPRPAGVKPPGQAAIDAARAQATQAASATPGRGTTPVQVALRRNVFPYIVGSLLSNTGTWFQSIAQSLLVYRLTGSVFLVGVVNASQNIALVLLASWVGYVSDRYDRRLVLISSQVGAIVVTGVMAVLAAAGLVSAAVVILLALVLGFANAFSAPVQKAMVATLVDRAAMPAVVTLDSMNFNLSRIAGPILAVVVLDHLGITWAFGLNSLSYVALILGLLLVRPARQQRPTGKTRLRESLALVWHDKRLLLLLACVAAFAASSDPVNTLSPAIATHVFHRSDTLTGYFVAAFGGGAVLAALVLTRRLQSPYYQLAAMLGLMSVGVAMFGAAGTLAVGIGGLVMAGFGYLGGQTQATSLLQLSIDDAQRGRIMALWSIAYMGSRPITGIIDGALASTLGLHAAALLMALPVFVLCIVVFFFARRGPAVVTIARAG